MRPYPADIYRPGEIGDLVCDLDDTGTVVSVSGKAVNIRISNGLLVSLVDSPGTLTAMSVYCPELMKMIGKGRLRIRVGSRVNLSQQRITMDRCMIDGSRSKRFDGIADAGPPFAFSSDRIALFEKILNFTGHKDGLSGIFRQRQNPHPFIQKGRGIAQKMGLQHPYRTMESLSGFVGLGIGFTPSGDELISGFLLGEKRFAVAAGPGKRDGHAPEKLSGHTKKILWRAAGHTSDGGRTLIWMALQGRFPRFLLDAAEKLGTAHTAREMLQAVSPAAKHGHTSGTDTLTGLLLYLKTVLSHHRHHCDRETGCLFEEKRVPFSG